MKEVSLKILFSVSSHSRFALSTPHRLTSFCVACSLRERTALLLWNFAFQIHRFNPWACLRFSQTASASCFLHHSVPSICFRLLRFPCCLCTASTLSTSCIVRFTLPLHSASTLTWYIPNTNSQAFRWFLPHRFVRIVHFLRNSSTFSGSIWSLPKPEYSIENSFVGSISHSIPCIKYS